MNNTSPFFSIVIPTYNRCDFISKSIESVLSQSYQNFEIIVVDDGSTDNTTEIVSLLAANDKRIRYYKKDNEERAVARNFGTDLAIGNYVNFLDSDDLFLPNHFLEAKKIIEKNNFPEVVHLNYRVETVDKKILYVSKVESDTNDFIIKGNPFSCHGVLIRKDVALLNKFNTDIALTASEDYELWLRLAAKYKFSCSDVVTSIVVQHDQRSIMTMINADKLTARFLKFLECVTQNSELVTFIGNRMGYFKMKNYLLLSVDLAANGHKKQAFKYLKIACHCSLIAFKERLFYATIKHIVIKK